MATLQISEYRSMALDVNGKTVEAAQLPPLAVQNITISGTSAQCAALNANTKFVRLIGDVGFRIEVGANPTATSSSQRHPADAGEYFGIDPASLIAAVTA